MSAESLSTRGQGPRLLSDKEAQLLVLLLEKAGPPWRERVKLEEMRASSMHDEGMGSVRLSRAGSAEHRRHFAQRIADLRYADADGVEIIASLNIDEHGDLFEMDVWKTDFSPTIDLAPPTSMKDLR